MVHTAVAMSLLLAAPSSKPVFSPAQVEHAIAEYFHESHVDLPRKYFSKILPAYGKSPPMLVMYLYGTSDWCGSSGCEVLILEMGRNGPKVVSEGNAWPPITFDGRSPSGYPFIGAWVHNPNLYCEEFMFQSNGLEVTRETKQEQAAEHRRCTSSKNILFNWPKKATKDR